MEFDVIQKKVSKATRRLLENDTHLLEVDASERAITHCFAVHLQEQFGGWHVDCEYNRQLDDVKRLFFNAQAYVREVASIYDSEAKSVYPDVIVHRRGTDDNLLVVEAKKASSSIDDGFDHLKLALYREQLGYRYGLFLRFVVGRDHDVREEEWFTDEGERPYS